MTSRVTPRLIMSVRPFAMLGELNAGVRRMRFSWDDGIAAWATTAGPESMVERSVPPARARKYEERQPSAARCRAEVFPPPRALGMCEREFPAVRCRLKWVLLTSRVWTPSLEPSRPFRSARQLA